MEGMAPLPTSRGKPFQSKLIPHEELIRTLRRKRVSYRQIGKILEREHGCKVYHKTIISFIRVRNKPIPEGLSILSRSTSSTDSATAIERLKSKPLPKAQTPVFVFDPDRPLTLKPNTKGNT